MNRPDLRTILTIIWIVIMAWSFIEFAQKHEVERFRMEKQLHPETQRL